AGKLARVSSRRVTGWLFMRPSAREWPWRLRSRCTSTVSPRCSDTGAWFGLRRRSSMPANHWAANASPATQASTIMMVPSRRSGGGLIADRLPSDQHLGQVALAFQPLLAVTGALLRQQHVHQRFGTLEVVDGQLHQAAGIRRHGGFAQLQRVHFTEALEAGDLYLAAFAFGLDAVDDAALLRIIQGVEHLLADIDPIQRRHGDEYVAGLHQGAERPDEQLARPAGDMQPIGVGVGQDANLAVTQLRQIRRTRIHTDGDRDVV